MSERLAVGISATGIFLSVVGIIIAIFTLLEARRLHIEEEPKATVVEPLVVEEPPPWHQSQQSKAPGENR